MEHKNDVPLSNLGKKFEELSVTMEQIDDLIAKIEKNLLYGAHLDDYITRTQLQIQRVMLEKPEQAPLVKMKLEELNLAIEKQSHLVSDEGLVASVEDDYQRKVANDDIYGDLDKKSA